MYFSEMEKTVKTILTVFIFCFLFLTAESQTIQDSCFSSSSPSIGFFSSSSLANVGGNADLLEWNGTSWVGAWPTALLTIGPPSNLPGCRAIFIGSATQWTTGGESFALALGANLIQGQQYTITVTYISHGVGSDNAFAPHVRLSSSSGLGNLIGTLPPVGNSWTTNSFSFIPNQGNYSWITFTTYPDGSTGLISSFCIECSTIIIPECEFDLGNDTTICFGDSLILSPDSPGSIFSWQDGTTDSTFTVTESGLYSLTVINGACTHTDSIFVDVSNEAQIELGNDTAFCIGGQLFLDVFKPNASYLWQDGSTNSTFLVDESGLYSVEINNAQCSFSDTINVSVIENQVPDLPNRIELCNGDSLEIDLNLSGFSINWSNGDTTSHILILIPGIYWVSFDNGICFGQDTIEVSTNSCISEIVFPNVFSPNNDGINDLFIPISMIGINKPHLEIFNRWGIKVYETDSPIIGWNGYIDQDQATEGVYFYVVSYDEINGVRKRINGSFTLIR